MSLEQFKAPASRTKTIPKMNELTSNSSTHKIESEANLGYIARLSRKTKQNKLMQSTVRSFGPKNRI
jgi:hypothetical protein